MSASTIAEKREDGSTNPETRQSTDSWHTISYQGAFNRCTLDIKRGLKKKSKKNGRHLYMNSYNNYLYRAFSASFHFVSDHKKKDLNLWLHPASGNGENAVVGLYDRNSERTGKLNDLNGHVQIKASICELKSGPYYGWVEVHYHAFNGVD